MAPRAAGRPQPQRVPLRDFAASQLSDWRKVLHDRLSEWEQWLQYMQPALGAMCWSREGCRAEVNVQSVCHVDHKIVAYHREALEVLFPMPTHRDRGCWWASQYAQTMEANVYFRGHILYFPGALRVLPGEPGGNFRRGRKMNTTNTTNHITLPSRASQYESHASYPRRCTPGISFTNLSTGVEARIRKLNTEAAGAVSRGEATAVANWKDVFATTYHDLRAVLRRLAWTNGTMQCFDKHVQHCREVGSADLPVRRKGGRVYYWDPSSRALTDTSTERALGLDHNFRQPCTADGPFAIGSEAVVDEYTLPRAVIVQVRRRQRNGQALAAQDPDKWKKIVFSKLSAHAAWKLAAYRCSEDELC